MKAFRRSRRRRRRIRSIKSKIKKISLQKIIKYCAIAALGVLLGVASSHAAGLASSEKDVVEEKKYFYYEGMRYSYDDGVKDPDYVQNNSDKTHYIDPYAPQPYHGRSLASKRDHHKMHTNHMHHQIHSGQKHMKVNDVPAEKALTKLKNGNLRFVQSRFKKTGKKKQDRIRLMAGQKPHTVVLACSDSRVPPEHVFDQSLGEITVIRSAGQSLGKAVIASIEYAVDQLGVQLIMVMGHESCGAVTTALQTMPNQSAGSPFLDAMVEDIRPRLAGYFRKPASSGILREVTANSRGVVRDLIKRSRIVRERVSSGRLEVRSSVYHFDSGVVHFH